MNATLDVDSYYIYICKKTGFQCTVHNISASLSLDAPRNAVACKQTHGPPRPQQTAAHAARLIEQMRLNLNGYEMNEL